MTFITAIQLKDSAIVVADNKFISFEKDNPKSFKEYLDSKIYSWNKGILTGVGEHRFLDKAIKLFVHSADSDTSKLPKCLNISRQIRELEIGQHPQVLISQLLYSEHGRLYSVSPKDKTDQYESVALKNNEIVLWFFNPDVSQIMDDLNVLYATLKTRDSFDTDEEWTTHYIEQFKTIYKKHSVIDPCVSPSFNIYFQTANDELDYFIRNTNNHMENYVNIKTNT
ncbi:hypothetical protein A6M14_13290 [Acinetobacter sp. Ac_877]|uniref:hypothetical protein n=1 Tax=Acinetobacter portensis TaxID=1839785 RepID=UPI00128C2571|nr:hypothetical protein [Acinetobacter portensis]MPW42667.1 hypothetical protein [Acinetobacter portensis]